VIRFGTWLSDEEGKVVELTNEKMVMIEVMVCSGDTWIPD
jgi:Tfp pilus assembly protein PilP